MRMTAVVFLLIAVTASLFSFGWLDGIRWAPAQVIFGVSLILFVLSAMAGFTPSVQVRPSRTTAGSANLNRPADWKIFSFGKIALFYVSLGGLGLIWCGIWYWYLRNHPPENDGAWYWCCGALLTSLGALILGLGIGSIFRSAQCTPPPEDTSATTTASNKQTAASVSVVTPGAAPCQAATNQPARSA